MVMDLEGGTHVLIFIYLVDRVFDNGLEWPCKEVFKIRVKSQKGGVADRLESLRISETSIEGRVC